MQNYAYPTTQNQNIINLNQIKVYHTIPKRGYTETDHIITGDSEKSRTFVLGIGSIVSGKSYGKLSLILGF